MIRLLPVLLFAFVITVTTPAPLTCVFSLNDGTEYLYNRTESSTDPYGGDGPCESCVYYREGKTEFKYCQNERCPSATPDGHARRTTVHDENGETVESRVYCCETDRCNDHGPVSCYESEKSPGGDAIPRTEMQDNSMYRLPCRSCFWERNADNHEEHWRSCFPLPCGGPKFDRAFYADESSWTPAAGKVKRFAGEWGGNPVTFEDFCCETDFCNDVFPDN